MPDPAANPLAAAANGVAPPVSQATLRPATAPADKKSLVDFYLDVILSGEKYPIEEWNVAQERYAGFPENEKREHLDAFRGQVNTLKSYLDQLEGTVRVSPAPGMARDENVQKEAECAQRLVQYAFRELGLRKVCGRALLAALMASAGAAVDSYDERRTMPAVRWIGAKQVAWDSNCQGDVLRAGWMAVYEFVSPEVLYAQSEGKLDLQKLRTAATKRPRTPFGDIDHRPDEGGKGGALNKRCLLWRFFGRNEYAIYDQQPVPNAPDGKGEADFSRFKVAAGYEPRRYLELVDGYDEPLADEPDWPREFALDWDQWPIHWLTFNEDLEHVAGFTDWRHVQRANDANENLSRAISNNATASLDVKFLARKKLAASKETIEAFLKTGDPTSVLEGMVDDQGKPLLLPVQRDQFRADLLAAAQFLQDKSDGAARIDEILRGMQGKPNQTLGEVEIRHEASMTSTNDRMGRYEDFEQDVARRWLEMAYATMPRYSLVSIAAVRKVPAQTDESGREIAPEQNELIYGEPQSVPWSAVAQILINNPGSEIKKLGVDAIVGEEIAQFWPEGVPLDVIRRNVRVYVEAGSTTRQARFQQVQQLTSLYIQVLVPLYQAVGRMDLAAQFVKLIVSKMGDEDAANLLPDAQQILQAQQLQQQAALAAAAGGAPGAVPPGQDAEGGTVPIRASPDRSQAMPGEGRQGATA